MQSRLISSFMLTFFALLSLFSGTLCRAVGTGSYNVTLTVTRSSLFSDGKDRTLVIARVSDPNGHQVTTEVDVQFQSTLGTPSSPRAQTFGGTAQVELSGAIVGVARVTALVAGAVSNTVEVVFTDDPAATFEGNNYVQINGSSYLAYSTTDQVIEGIGKKAGAKLTFRNVEITADHLQLDCVQEIVRAQGNVTVRRGKVTAKVDRLYYRLFENEGFALAEKDGRLQTVLISGTNLLLESVKEILPNTYLKMAPLQVKLIVTAGSITYFPGAKLQFRHAKFFQDQTQLLAMPYYEMTMGATELFSDQFVSVGTRGLGLELPFYYDLTPRSMGVVMLRHQEQIGRSSFSQENGWDVDVQQGYSSQKNQRYEGQYGFTGLTRSNWGFSWNHSQSFNNLSQGNFYLDFPQHDSVLSSVNYTQQNRVLRWGTTLSASQVFSSDINSLRSNIYVETQQHRVSALRNMLVSFGANLISGRTHTNDSTIGDLNESTEGVTMRVGWRPRILDKRTTFSDSFSVGQVWSNQGRDGISKQASLSLNHTLAGGAGNMSLTYDYIDQPGGLIVATGKHRIGMTYSVSATKRFEVLLYGSAYLDTNQSSLLTDFSYRMDKNWHLLASTTLQKYLGQNYNDIEFSVGRRVGARELRLTYSTLFQRVSLDLMSSRF